jgi:hypothetical protein
MPFNTLLTKALSKATNTKPLKISDPNRSIGGFKSFFSKALGPSSTKIRSLTSLPDLPKPSLPGTIKVASLSSEAILAKIQQTQQKKD